jgi:hypothetical protein
MNFPKPPADPAHHLEQIRQVVAVPPFGNTDDVARNRFTSRKVVRGAVSSMHGLGFETFLKKPTRYRRKCRWVRRSGYQTYAACTAETSLPDH